MSSYSKRNRSFTPSSRPIESSLRVYRQMLPSCIPEYEPISFKIDEFDRTDDVSSTSDFLFSSPKKAHSNNSQTIKQQPRVYPKTVSRVLASSPAYQNQYRATRPAGQTTASTTVSSSASCSPCLSPIRYALDTSAQTNQNLFSSNDESSLKVVFQKKKESVLF